MLEEGHFMFNQMEGKLRMQPTLQRLLIFSEVVRMKLMRLVRGGPPMEQQQEINLEDYAGMEFVFSSFENLDFNS
ncbi:UNVERIFIED_CONTAM: hypothetical protein Sradi_5434300 [Sesamum radiatum]|uniref:Uncharacterized protein n=1 Tax=Sesamum radiatum TaxID=300843 RepID=A0AAW2LBK9_SESRA